MDPRRSMVRLREVERDATCPLCGREGVVTSWKDHTFSYGSGGSEVELTVSVPVRRCAACEFEYLDESAERLKHDSICRHLGVLSPAEIRLIREGHGMTRARFAQVTGLGEASLNRWENGLTIQTHANDRYLRLLARPEIMRQLEELMAPEPPVESIVVVAGNRFRALEVTPALLAEQEGFRLRKAA